MHSLVARQLRKAFGRDAALSPEILAFAALISDAYVAADEDRKRLEHSLELASTELFERNRAMATILENVAQGFATVDLAGTVAPQCSPPITAWFGPIDPAVPVWRYLFGDSDLATWTELGIHSLASGDALAEVILDQLPKRVDRCGRQLRIEYRPIGSPLAALLVVVTDVTEELARADRDRLHGELLAFVERMSSDRASLLEFLAITDELIAECRKDLPLRDLHRVIHTIKGNTAVFGVTSVADACHQLETDILETGTASDAQRDVVVAAWRAFRDRAARLVENAGTDVIVIDRDEHRAAVAEIGDGPGSKWLARWGESATRPYLERFADQAHALAARLAKPALDIEIADHGVRVERARFAPLWPALVHAVRNAVAHGVEPQEQREARGKPECAHLVLRTQLDNEALVVEIEDDGPGIDWDALRAKAQQLGVREDGDALFANGVSTSSEVDDISGRGVGMGALRSVCWELGGKIEVLSTPSRGTTVRCIVPLVQIGHLRPFDANRDGA